MNADLVWKANVHEQSMNKSKKTTKNKTKIKPFIDKYDWEEKNYPSEKDDLKEIDKNNLTIVLNVLCTKKIVKNKLFFWWFQTEKDSNTCFFIRKPIFVRDYAEIFLIFFLTFLSLFYLILYLIRFNTDNKCHFLDNGEIK